MIAALFVETDGIYADCPDIELWDKARDARRYSGPYPVIAHPPCERWGKFWHGSTRKPRQYEIGDDQGCFAAALAAVRKYGGILEHPHASHAWRAFGLNIPPRHGGWITADFEGGWTCCVEQGHYGHIARKPTWLYWHNMPSTSCQASPPNKDLAWGFAPQRLHPIALARYGYAKARKIGMVAMIGGSQKKALRAATPQAFRDVLISMVQPCQS